MHTSTMHVALADKAGIVELVQGDITRADTDAIVNAANSELLPGGGVCGAIHRAGGPTIADECARIREEHGPVAPGHAVATMAGKLTAKYVIHTVGPVWRGGNNSEADTLASCYRESIRLANELKLQSIAFPAIATGIFGYPLPEAAQVAVKAVAGALVKTQQPHRVRFVVFDAPAFAAFAEALRSVTNTHPKRLLENPFPRS